MPCFVNMLVYIINNIIYIQLLLYCGYAIEVALQRNKFSRVVQGNW